jgi:hypothetical protein
MSDIENLLWNTPTDYKGWSSVCKKSFTQKKVSSILISNNLILIVNKCYLIKLFMIGFYLQ